MGMKARVKPSQDLLVKAMTEEIVIPVMVDLGVPETEAQEGLKKAGEKLDASLAAWARFRGGHEA